MRTPPGASRVAQEVDHGYAQQMLGAATGGERKGKPGLPFERAKLTLMGTIALAARASNEASDLRHTILAPVPHHSKP